LDEPKIFKSIVFKQTNPTDSTEQRARADVERMQRLEKHVWIGADGDTNVILQEKKTAV
jgi:hypothetical protein